MGASTGACLCPATAAARIGTMSDTSLSLLEQLLQPGDNGDGWRQFHDLYRPLLQRWRTAAGLREKHEQANKKPSYAACVLLCPNGLRLSGIELVLPPVPADAEWAWALDIPAAGEAISARFRPVRRRRTATGSPGYRSEGRTVYVSRLITVFARFAQIARARNVNISDSPPVETSISIPRYVFAGTGTRDNRRCCMLVVPESLP